MTVDLSADQLRTALADTDVQLPAARGEIEAALADRDMIHDAVSAVEGAIESGELVAAGESAWGTLYTPAGTHGTAENRTASESGGAAWDEAATGEVVDSGTFPEQWADREQWMGHTHGQKNPFAPWADHDHPEADPDDDARWKWGLEDNYADLATAREWTDKHPQLAGVTYLLRDADSEPFAFVDGDDVRCPETGEWHPAFVGLLEDLGITYADVSTSGSGVHAVYRGDLPDGVKQAKLPLDDEPWGANDDPPVAELYDHKKVCVTTGDHVPSTPTDVREWDDDALADRLDEHGLLPDGDPAKQHESFDSEDYEPTATDAEEVTTDIRDIYAAIDRLNAQRVADKTIVASWNDDATTSDGERAFVPTWGRNANGTANIVNRDRWLDTGGNGYGGPTAMAAIDGVSGIDESIQGAPSGDDWWAAVDHLRELGFQIPRHRSHDLSGGDRDRPSAEDEGDTAATDGGETVVEDTTADGPDDSLDANADAARGAESPAEDDGGGDGGDPDDPDDGGDSGDSYPWDDIYWQYADADGADERLVPRYEATNLLMEQDDWLCPVETDHLWRYDPDTGIYRDDGEAQLRDTLVDGLREQFKAHEQSEISEQIRGRATVREDDLGGPAWYVATQDCVLKLDPSGEATTHDHSPEYNFISRLATPYDPDADCPRFRAFLQETVDNERDRKTLQEFAGYTLHHWGLPYHKALFLVGPTASGKSTFLDTIRAMLGDDATANLTPQQMTDERFGGAELYGAWANIRNDIPATTIDDTGAFKEIVAGDPIKAEQKYEDPFMFEPDAKHMFSANQLPDADIEDEAFFRRILLVAFPSTIPRGQRDPNLDAKLQDELPGVLNWALAGLQRLLQQGRFTGDQLPGATQETWQKWGNSVERFHSVCLEESDGSRLPKQEVHQAFLAYCEDEGIPAESQHALTRGLKLQGVDDDRAYVDGDRQRVYTGVDYTGRGREYVDGGGGDRDGGPANGQHRL